MEMQRKSLTLRTPAGEKTDRTIDGGEKEIEESKITMSEASLSRK